MSWSSKRTVRFFKSNYKIETQDSSMPTIDDGDAVDLQTYTGGPGLG